jgi:hypothetical protein
MSSSDVEDAIKRGRRRFSTTGPLLLLILLGLIGFWVLVGFGAYRLWQHVRRPVELNHVDVATNPIVTPTTEPVREPPKPLPAAPPVVVRNTPPRPTTMVARKPAPATALATAPASAPATAPTTTRASGDGLARSDLVAGVPAASPTTKATEARPAPPATTRAVARPVATSVAAAAPSPTTTPAAAPDHSAWNGFWDGRTKLAKGILVNERLYVGMNETGQPEVRYRLEIDRDSFEAPGQSHRAFMMIPGGASNGQGTSWHNTLKAVEFSSDGRRLKLVYRASDAPADQAIEFELDDSGAQVGIKSPTGGGMFEELSKSPARHLTKGRSRTTPGK